MKNNLKYGKDISDHESSYDVCVIGGGIGGSIAAIELAEAGYEIIILEKKPHILEGSSNVTPGRMGLGFHYAHEETAITYLKSSIEFVKKYLPEVKHLRIGENKPLNHYSRRGRYFITHDSLFTVDKILQIYEKLKNEYHNLCYQDEKNKVFGEPENFYTKLKPEEYEEFVDKKKVALGIETAEHLLDWPRFRQYICHVIENHLKIKILTSNEVVDFTYDIDSERHIVISKDEENIIYKKRVISADYIINCAWENVESLTTKAGLVEPNKKSVRTNRLKILAEVDLPQSLRKQNSMFFCMGPHCMFSNMRYGKGLMSYANATNFMSSEAVKVPTKILNFLYYDNSNEKNREIEETAESKGKEIIDGVSKYIPEMKKAVLLGVRFGIVMTEGSVNIYDHSSPFHQRNYSGVDSNFPIGWINNSCMKLLYGYNNAREIVNIVKKQKQIKNNILRYSLEIEPYDKIKSKILSKIFLKYHNSNEFLEKNCHKLIQEIKKTVETKNKISTKLLTANINLIFNQKNIRLKKDSCTENSANLSYSCT